MSEVCEGKATPLSYLIKKQCDMMYKGHINIKDIRDNNAKLSFIVQRLLGAIVRDHCYMHKIDYKERQMLANVLGIKEQEVPIGTR